MENSILRIWGAICFLPLFYLSSFGQTSTPLAANGRLQIINRQLSNEAGTPIQLRGMSTHGLHWFDQCYNVSTVQTLATDWGIDVFRAAMYVDEGGYMNNKVGLRNKINQIVDWTAQSGVYCIIDWHILNPGDPNIHTADAIEFFGLMAQQHAGKKHVIYEICNEPNGVSWSSIKSYAEQIIPVIRQYDPEAIILVGTPSWSGAPGDVRSNPLTGANAYNIMYTFHFYAGSHYSQSYIDDVIKTVPLFVSEWGTSNYSGNGGNDYNNAQNWASLMAGNNTSGIKVSWCNWSFCDKDESSAALNPGACSSNNWNNTSTSGTWVKDRILNPADNFGPPTPFISITSPANNSTVPIGSNLTVSAGVGNTTATTVEFYNGTTKLGEDATAPYSWTVTNIQAGTYSFTAKAILSAGGTLMSSSVQVTAAPAPNQPPTVSLTSPVNNTTLTAPATVTISANAADSDGSIAKVEFYNGSTKLGEDTSTPYSFDWSNVAAGAYTITAKAIDNQNAATTSGVVTIYVNNPGNPTADIIGPDCVSANETKLFELNVANLTNASSFAWWCTGSTQSMTPVSGQPYKISINFGPNFSGGQVCIGVNYSAAPWYRQFCKAVTVCTGTPPPVNQAPTVSLTSPINNVTFTAPASIAIAANAADSDGSIVKVEFYNGSTKLGEDLSSPYTFSWTSVVAGTYSITAKATDNQGAITTSSAASVIVNAVTPPAGADIVGPDCIVANDVKIYELSAANLANATAVSWWCTGSTQSVASGQPSFGKVTINFGPWFSGGQVCVGVNYSAFPWYKQYCKSVTVCSSARVGASDWQGTNPYGVVFPNPSQENFTFIADKKVRQLTVNDIIGYSRISFERLTQGDQVTFGEELPTGSYVVVVSYEDKTQKAIKVLKVTK